MDSEIFVFQALEVPTLLIMIALGKFKSIFIIGSNFCQFPVPIIRNVKKRFQRLVWKHETKRFHRIRPNADNIPPSPAPAASLPNVFVISRAGRRLLAAEAYRLVLSNSYFTSHFFNITPILLQFGIVPYIKPTIGGRRKK